VCTLVAKELGVRRLHFEVGNLPGKLFVDPEGVNARSSLMARDLRSEGAIDVEKTRAYLNSHRARKEQAHLVPQRRRTVRNWSLLLDYAYNCTHPYALVEDEISPMVKGARKLVGIGTQLYFRDYDAIDMQRPFFMVPMQVEADSQLLLNSSVSMYECVCEALHDAEARGVHLVVKPHPAEEAEVTLRRIAALRRAHPLLKISNKNTYRLIKHALKVYTVNSTVGIEALMYYKHVKVFGESFYSRYCEPDLDVPVDTAGVEHFLSRYIFDVLVDGDFFGSDIVALPQRFWEQ
jgi:capsular polysaccharide export protein